MRVVAMLAWWDEPPADLYACIGSMRVLCDAVVAADGAWDMTPGAAAASPAEQVDAIKKAAHDHGLDCSLILPARVWSGQVEKRNAMLNEAAQGADWLIAVDADHRLVGKRETLRAELAGVEADTILHDFATLDGPGEAPHPWHADLRGRTIETSLLFRRLDDMRVERMHWGYTGVRDGLRVGLGAWREAEPTRTHRLEGFRVDHLCFARDAERLERNRDYCLARDAFVAAHGVEP